MAGAGDSSQDILKDRIQKASSLLCRVENLLFINGSNRLKRKFTSELRFLADLEGHPLDKVERHLRSSNLPYLEAVLKVVESLSEVEGIFVKYDFQDHDGRGKHVTVDVVSQFERQWVKVIARNPTALYQVWQGQGQYGSKDMCVVANELIAAKEHVCIDPDMTSIVFHFESGIVEEMAQSLTSLGITVSGHVVAKGDTSTTILSRPFPLVNQSVAAKNHALEPAKVNLDITALVAIVSSVTNGGCNFVFKDKILNQQAAEERMDPVLPKINEYLSGKELYVCRTAHNDFCSILNTVGGACEKKRAKDLLSKTVIVDDTPSEKSLCLTESGRIRQRSLVIFGTGDSLKATTLTANAAFVRAACNQGVKFRVFFHSSRALTEQKEATAAIL